MLTIDIRARTHLLVLTHVLGTKRFENNYLRTPLGGFYNHSE